MPRHARCYYDTSFFHVIVQGIKKEYIFKNEKYIQEYLRLIELYEKDCEVKVLAYCIMNNHAHLLVYTPTSKDMAVFMKKVNTSYAMFYNRWEDGRVGYVFRDRYLSEHIKDEGYFIKCINYIHNNPVKAGMVSFPSEYAYSSYKDFIEGDRTNENLDLIDEMIKKLFIKN